MKKTILIIILALSLIQAVLAATYGNLRYGIGLYGIGEAADTTFPIVNTTLNKSLSNILNGDVINITANITDEVGLSFCQIIINQSGPTALEFINISLEGATSAQCSNSSPVTLAAGGVINYTIRANDTSNNFRTNDTIVTVTTATTSPVIRLNNIITFAVDPIAGSSVGVLISFNVTDAQGIGNINASKAVVNLTLGYDDGQWRSNVSEEGISNDLGTCANGTHVTQSIVQVNCTVVMRYYDNTSSKWFINVSVKDTDGLIGRNGSTFSFTYNSLSSFKITSRSISEQANLNFSGLNLGAENQEAKAPILLNNTGNADFDLIRIMAANLVGITTPTETIAASNFFINATNTTVDNKVNS